MYLIQASLAFIETRCQIYLSRGCSLKTILVHPQKKSEKSDWEFKIRIPYLGMNRSSNSVFKFSGFLYKIFVHPKKISKNPYTLFGSEQPLDIYLEEFVI